MGAQDNPGGATAPQAPTSASTVCKIKCWSINQIGVPQMFMPLKDLEQILSCQDNDECFYRC